MKKETRLTGHYTGIQIGYWAAMAVFNSLYVPILRSRGFDGSEISILLALRYGFVIAAQPVLASFADKHAKTIPLKYLVVGINITGLAASVLFAVLRPGAIGTGILIAVTGCAMGLLVSFNDSLAMQYVNQGIMINYSFARAFGSVAFAVSSLCLGFLIEGFGIECAPYAQVIILSVKLLIVLTFQKCEVKTEKAVKKQVHSAGYLLKNYSEFTIFLVAVLFLYVGNVMYLNFVVDMVGQLGGNSTNLGIIHFVMSVSELPLAFTIAKIRKKISNKILLVISTVFIVMRMVLVMGATSLFMLTIVQVLNMLGFGIYFSSSVLFVNEIIPKEDQVKGQSLMGIASSAGLAGMIGSLGSGQLSAAFGVNAVMQAVVGCMIAGMTAMIIAVLVNRRKNRYKK